VRSGVESRHAASTCTCGVLNKKLRRIAGVAPGMHTLNEEIDMTDYRYEHDADGTLIACTFANDPANPESWRYA